MSVRDVRFRDFQDVAVRIWSFQESHGRKKNTSKNIAPPFFWCEIKTNFVKSGRILEHFTDVRFATISVLTDVRFGENEISTNVRIRGFLVGGKTTRGKKTKQKITP